LGGGAPADGADCAIAGPPEAIAPLTSSRASVGTPLLDAEVLYGIPGERDMALVELGGRSAWGLESAPVDISKVSVAQLRAIATRNLAECCVGCRALLRRQLQEEEEREGGGAKHGGATSTVPYRPRPPRRPDLS
jgi:hypothetical protein